MLRTLTGSSGPGAPSVCVTPGVKVQTDVSRLQSQSPLMDPGLEGWQMGLLSTGLWLLKSSTGVGSPGFDQQQADKARKPRGSTCNPLYRSAERESLV